jgi:CPA2 family monovalent cation:H+ antiporter-2
LAPEPEPETTSLSGHAILVGYGRVGGIVGEEMRAKNGPFVVIEDDESRVRSLRAERVEAIYGNGVLPGILAAANVAGARVLIVAIPDGFEAGALVMHAKELNPAIRIVARAHSDAEVEHLLKHGADKVIMGEKEIADGMVDYVFQEPGFATPGAAA